MKKTPQHVLCFNLTSSACKRLRRSALPPPHVISRSLSRFSERFSLKKAVLWTALILVGSVAYAQPPALELGAGSQVRNTIIFDNLNASPVSADIPVTFSASDSVLPEQSNNIQLSVSPFSSGFQIDMGTLVFDGGNSSYLRTIDTVDLGFNPRISCDEVDIGAFEFQVIPTQITVQPVSPGRVCEGSDVTFFVEATGQPGHITFQWQRNGVDLVGPQYRNPTLTLSDVSLADTGYFRVIVFGVCCNDTSDVVRLDVDLRPMVVAMNDVTILPGEDVTLYVTDYIGTVVWFHSDMETEVQNLTITNINTSTQFFATATNGVCRDTAIASVQIIVDGLACRVRTPPDAIVCSGDPFRLLIYDATVTARWYSMSGTELPNGSLVRPGSTMQFVLVGFNESGNICARDTLTLIVPQSDFTVRADGTFCMGSVIQLYSVPVADVWLNAAGQPIGTGDIYMTPAPGTTTIFTAQITDHVTGCVTQRDVSITVNPPDLTLPFATHIEGVLYRLAVCYGDLVHLYTNIDPMFIDWRDENNQPLGNDPIVLATENRMFRAWGWDPACGDIFVDLELIVDAIPDFEILPQTPVYIGTEVTLASVPNTPIWTDIYGTRVFMPLTIYETQYVVGVFVSGACEVRDTILVEAMELPPPPPPAMEVSFTTTIATNRECDNAGVTVTVTGGTPPYDFEWTRVGHDDFWQQPNNLDGVLRLFNVVSGVYNFIIFDSEENYLRVQIPVRCEHEQVMPTILVTPNNDGLNDYLYIAEIEFFPINTVTIISSYGAEIMRIQNYCNHDPNRRWGGQNRAGQYVPDGTYWYVVQAHGVPPMTGWIIVRGSPGR